MKKLEGIGGWLLIYVILLFGSIFILIFSLTTPTSLSIFILELIRLILLICAIILILCKKRIAIGINIAILWFCFIISIIEIMIFEDYYVLIRYLVFTIIWTLYFNKSKRVKNTLIN